MDLKNELVRLEDIYICDDDKENIRRLNRIIGIIDEALDCLKMNFMLAGQDEFGNDIDFICYKQEEKTLLERRELVKDYIRDLYTPDIKEEIKQNYKDDDVYRRLKNIYINLFHNNPWMTEDEKKEELNKIRSRILHLKENK